MDQLTHKRRILRGAAAAFVLAAAFLFAVGVAIAEAPAPVDTGKNVQPGECSPCHLDLGKVNQPGLVFDHGAHLLVSCAGCHSRFPHRPGGSIESVPMETCFACHGVQHGPQGELASSACRDCHTQSVNLRPKTHTRAWKKKPHANASKRTGVNDCMMCHDSRKDCDACHKRESVKVKIPNEYHSVVTVRKKGPGVKIYPTGEVTMSQCVYCHPDIDKITGGGLIFAHTEHLRRNYPCEACHRTFPHEGEKRPETPDMMSCYRCHGLRHASRGVVAGEECSKCHPKSFELKPNDHTTPFALGAHKKRAGSDPAYCSMCHKPQFCIDCHSGKRISPNAPGKAVIPESHTDAKWQGLHGKLFGEAKGACGACHTGPSCQRCHVTVMPHPAGWIENHRPPEGVPPEDCNVCHHDRDRCQSCHHQSVKNAELLAKNCTRCHDQMNYKPATQIKNKAYAEHAVHFGVSKKKGKPYKCYECHVDFGGSEAARKLELQQGHDLRLCYSCHGALDLRSVLIAPYQGAELCRRCHTNLNI
ncbi:MAG: hypothetical protein HY876_04845 [Coriobacteriales bacterium]|nr:hypothetical protein [Coriobacteriales bacterium]